jgi:hypothetical protein
LVGSSTSSPFINPFLAPPKTIDKGFIVLFYIHIQHTSFFCGTGDCTQGLHLESLHHEGFFQDRVSQTICLGLALNHNPPELCLLSS